VIQDTLAGEVNHPCEDWRNQSEKHADRNRLPVNEKDPKIDLITAIRWLKVMLITAASIEILLF
jgi:hypothetical protein